VSVKGPYYTFRIACVSKFFGMSCLYVIENKSKINFEFL